VQSDSKKVALITGANKGIGFEVARELGKANCTVLLGARKLARAGVDREHRSPALEHALEHPELAAAHDMTRSAEVAELIRSDAGKKYLRPVHELTRS